LRDPHGHKVPSAFVDAGQSKISFGSRTRSHTGRRSFGRVAPSITVVIPTHDRRDLVLWTLRSVLRQRDVDFEVVVVDDGSTDGTSGAIQAVADPRVRILRHEVSLGVAAARNAGATAASGEWIALLDDDDLWSPDKLVLQLKAVQETESSWVYGGVVEIDLHGRVLTGGPPPSPESLLSVLPRKNLMPAGCSNVMVRAHELSSAGGFDPKLRHLADWDLWLRLARVGPPAVAVAPVVAYRLHPAQATLDPAGMVEEAEVLASRHGADRASIYRWLAWSELRRGHRKDALSAYVRAVGTGDLLSLGRMAVAAVHPRPTSVRGRRMTDESLEWQGEAAAWLRELHA
jgi:glycosyltransferase involved in cell wall biosynthesis